MEEEGTVRGPRCGDGRGGKAERVKEVKEDDRGCVGGGGSWKKGGGGGGGDGEFGNGGGGGGGGSDVETKTTEAAEGGGGGSELEMVQMENPMHLKQNRLSAVYTSSPVNLL